MTIGLHNWILDGEAVRGKAGTLEQHFEANGKRLASVSQIYYFIKHLHKTRNPALSGLIADLSHFFTGTRINYVRNIIFTSHEPSLECFGLRQIQEQNIEGDYLDNLIRTDYGLDIIQAMFRRLDVYDIPDIFYAATGKRAYLQLDHPAAWRIPSDKIVSLHIDSEAFKINCDNLLRDSGQARGLYVPANL